MTTHNKAWKLLAEPGAWTQKKYAKTKEGGFADPMDERACSFCTVGALQRVYGYGMKNIHAKNQLAAEVGSIIDWNDAPGRTQEEVVAVLRELDL